MTDDVRALLPWYVNGTLSDDEKAAVESLLSESQAAREELDWLRQLHATAQASRDDQPSELGWQRLKRQIRVESEQQDATKPVAESRFTHSKWMPRLAVAASLVVAVQLGVFYQQTREVQPVEPLSGQPVTVQQGWLIQVEFDLQADWRTIVATLDQLGATIVEGPSPAGLVRLNIDPDRTTHATVDQLIAWLNEQPHILHVADETPP